MLPDAQVAQLRFFEVGVDPDFVKRADRHQMDRHQILADLNIVARIDVEVGWLSACLFTVRDAKRPEIRFATKPGRNLTSMDA